MRTLASEYRWTADFTRSIEMHVPLGCLRNIVDDATSKVEARMANQETF